MRLKFSNGDLGGAIARIAAPYPHPRAPAATPVPEFVGLSDAKLDALDLRE